MTTEEQIHELIFTAIGEASMCWENRYLGDMSQTEVLNKIGNDLIEALKQVKVPLPCAYCSKPEFKGWSDGKCPYCGVMR